MCCGSRSLSLNLLQPQQGSQFSALNPHARADPAGTSKTHLSDWASLRRPAGQKAFADEALQEARQEQPV